MKKALTVFIEDKDRIEKSIQLLSEKYPDDLVNNDIVLDMKGKPALKNNIIKQSAKRNNFSNITLVDSNIENSAFAGSQFNNFVFNNCAITGNSFVSCIFEKTKIISDERKKYIGNNFSNSFVDHCVFSNIEFLSSSWIGTSVEKTVFDKCKINSCTLEGTSFIDCTFSNVDISTGNLDYMILTRTYLNNVSFPFYQFAYIIGAADYLSYSKTQCFNFVANKKKISLSEYLNSIPELLDYYFSRQEYFPLANLFFSIGNKEEAKNYIFVGVKSALKNNDFRMIKYFCIMANQYNLLEYDFIKGIKSSLNNYLLNLTDNDDENMLQCLIKTSEIINILEDRTSNKTYLQFEIQTNIDRNDENNQEIINELVEGCKYILDNSTFEIEGHTIKEISYCPVDLVFQVIGNLANILAISAALQQFVFYIKTKKSKKPKKIAKDICKKYDNINLVDSDSRIELAKAKVELAMEEVKNYRGFRSGEEYNDFITEITQKIIGDVDNILDKDMLVMKVDI